MQVVYAAEPTEAASRSCHGFAKSQRRSDRKMDDMNIKRSRFSSPTFLPSTFLPSFRGSSDGKTDAGKKIDGMKSGAKEIYSHSPLLVIHLLVSSAGRVLFRIIPNLTRPGYSR